MAVTRRRPFSRGVRKCKPRDSFRGCGRDDLQRLDDAGHNLVLETRVQIFGVFPNDDQVDVGVTRLDPGQAKDRPNVSVELEPLSQLDVHAGETRTDRRSDGALERDAVVDDGIDNGVGQRRARTGQDRRAGILPVPFDVDPRPFKDQDNGVGHLRTDSVAGN